MRTLPIIFLFLSVMLLASCKAQRIVKFTTGQFKYLLEVPANYKLSKVADDHGFREHRFVYPDSSIIYITNDARSGGAINTAKARKYGNDIYLKILSSDTLDINGNEGDKYWREQKLNDVVLSTLRRRK